jgi:hypothetical protein
MMRTALYVLAAIGLLGVGHVAEPTWREARAPGTGCLPPRCHPGQVPLATPVVSHAGRIVMIGDGAATQVYDSRDARAWRGFGHDARWGVRYKAADASHAGALWRVGGFVEQRGRRTLMNDVWRSVDGRRWQRVLERSPWPARSGAHLVSFRDTLWLIGGEPSDGRIWLTTDGRNWSARHTAALPPANPQAVRVHRDALWILGHGAWGTATSDVWTSSDGATWTPVTTRAEWPARTGAGFAVLADRLWVVGGAGRRDVWSSSDGRRWQRAPADLPGPPRDASYSVVFEKRFWVFGGKTGGLGGTGFWDGVWSLQ